MTSPSDDSPYTRRDKRVDLDADVSMAFEQTRSLTKEQILNVSVGGMFVETERQETVGSLAQFEIRLEGESQPIEGVGEVVWVRKEIEGAGRPAGMGVRFLALDPRSRDRLEALMAQQEAKALASPGAAPSTELEPENATPPPSPLDSGRDWPGAGEPWPWLEASSEGAAAETPVDETSSGVLNESGLYYSAGHPRRPWWRIPLIVGVILILLGVGIAAVEHFIGAGPEAESNPAPVKGSQAAPPPRHFPAPAPAAAASSSEEAKGARRPTTTDSMTVTVPLPESPPRAAASMAGGDRSVGGDESGSSAPRSDSAPAGEPSTTGSTGTVTAQGGAEPVVPSAQRSATRVVKVEWKSSPNATSVTIHADGKISSGSYDVMRLGGSKPRVVLRLRGIDQSYSPTTLEVASRQVERIRSGLHEAGRGSELHLVFDLTQSSVGLERIEANGDQLHLVFGPGNARHGRS